jgi:predicted 2-oxoglutarate/Fe(II)-dependent dioxygenase YbiX
MENTNFTDLTEVDEPAPVASVASKEILSITTATLFSSEECEKIKATAISELWLKTKVIGDQNLHHGERQKLRGELSGFPFSEIHNITKEANDKIFDFNLLGVIDQDYPQMFRYKEKGYYGLHVDINPLSSTRKLSFIINLNDSSEYTGGEIEFLNTKIENDTFSGIGNIIIFPSFLPYQIKPVLSGEKYIITGHIHGPHYK